MASKQKLRSRRTRKERKLRRLIDHAARYSGARQFEPLEPRIVLSADSVLGGGARAAIIDAFEDYGSLFESHMGDAGTDFNARIPGILVTQRDTDADADIDDKDIEAPSFRDLLAVEVEQHVVLDTANPTSPNEFNSPNFIYDTLTGAEPHPLFQQNQEYFLGVLDTDNSSTVSWYEAYRGIVVGAVDDLLRSFDTDNDKNVPEDDIDNDNDVDADDVEKWVRDGLDAQFGLNGLSFPRSSHLANWFRVDLDGLSTSGSSTFNLSFTADINFVDTYLIDLGLDADAAEVELPEWEFDFGGINPDVDPLTHDVSIWGEVEAPIAVRSTGTNATFAANGDLVSSIKAGGDGDESLVGQKVNVGFLGTEAGSGSEFELSMTIETEMLDPSSPERLGFQDEDASPLVFEATSSAGIASTGGSISATEGPDQAFDLATPILFDLVYTYDTGDSGDVLVNVDVSSASDTNAVETALEAAINASSLAGLLNVTQSSGNLSISLLGGDATPLGFTDGTHSDNAAPYKLTGSNGFDFDSINDDDVEDPGEEVSFAESTFLLSLNGGLPSFVTVAAGTYDSGEWQTAVQDGLNAAGLGAVTASVDTTDLNAVTVELSAGNSLEIVDTDTLSLTMSAINAITQSELNDLEAANQLSRLFTSTPDTSADVFEITLNLEVADGLDFTPTGSPTLVINADSVGGPFGLDRNPVDFNVVPDLREDFNGSERFALPLIDPAGNDLLQFLDFNVFGPAETIAMVQQLEGWLERLEQHVSLGGWDIPLAQSVLGQILDFSDLVQDEFLVDDLDDDDDGNDVGKLLDVVNDLDPDNPSVIFFTAQEFGAALDFIGILDTTGLPAGAFATYEPGPSDDGRNILYHVDAVEDFATEELPVDFTLDLAPLGNIQSESSVFVVAEAGFEAILGLRMGLAGSLTDTDPLADLNNGIGVNVVEGPAVTAAMAVERVEGRLLTDAIFEVSVDGGAFQEVLVSASATSTFTTTAQLLSEIQSELDSTLGANTVIAEKDGARIKLRAGSSVTTLALSVDTSNTAYTQLGLQSGPARTVSVVSNPVTDPGGGDGGDLTITIFGSPGVALTLDNAAGNLSVTNLVDDINEKIVGTSLENKIVASRLGDRIVFNAIDKNVHGFSVAADGTADNFFDSFSTLNAWLEITAPNEPDPSKLARYGRLSTGQPFDLTIDDGTTSATISVAVNETEGFGSLADFANLLNTKIAASFGGSVEGDTTQTVVAEVVGTRLALRADDSAVATLVASSPSAGAMEMGFVGMLTAGRLGVTGNRAAPSYFGPTNDATFDLSLVGYTGAGPSSPTVTLSYLNGLGSPAEIITNANIYDLAGDLQRALNTAFGGASENPLLVGVDAGRLLFTIKAGTSGHDVTGFTITADPTSAAEARAISELKLFDVNDAAPLVGIATLVANNADLLIQDRDGTFWSVALKDLVGDPLTTVGEVKSAITTQTSGAVVADIEPTLAQGLILTDTTGGTSNPLVVRTVNGSNAAIDLGIYLGGINAADDTAPAATIEATPDIVVGDTIGTLALFDRVFLRQVDSDTPILRANFDVESDNPDTAGLGGLEELFVEANFGFVAVTLQGGGTLEGDVDIELVNEDTGRTTLRDLFSAVAEDRNGDFNIDIDDFTEVVKRPEFELLGQFELDVNIVPGGGVEAVIDNLTVGSLRIVANGDTGDPFNEVFDVDLGQFVPSPIPPDVFVDWTPGDLGDLLEFQNIDFEDVLNALKALADFLDDYAALSFLNQDIPLIGINFNDLVDLADRFRIAVEDIEANPAGSVQLLEQKIREEFGLPPGVLTLALADGEDGDSDPDDMLKIRFDLGGAFSESLPVAFAIPDDVISGAPLDLSLEGHADLNVTGDLTALFTIGVDLGTPLGDDAPVFLYTHESETQFAGNLTASANDLTFNAALGPAGVTIADGFASLGIMLAIGSGDAMGTRVPLNGAFAVFDEKMFSGEADAVMPIYFPTQSTYVGDITLEADFDTTGITNLDVDAPNFGTLDFESFSIFDNIGLLIDATDFFLSGVQDVLDGQILGFDLPLVGNELAEAARFIEDFRSSFVKDLRNLVENAPSLGADIVQEFLFNLLHTELGLLDDTNGVGGITIDDVIIEGKMTLTDGDAANDFLQWNVLLGQDLGLVDINTPFDLGFPGLGFDGQIGLDVMMGWELGFGMGISLTEGAYIDIRRQDYTTADPNDILPELQLTFDVILDPASELSGELLFLQLDIEEAPQDLDGVLGDETTHFHAEFAVDLTKDGDTSVERLGFSELGSLDFVLDLSADAAVNLDLTLKFNEDLIGESPLSAVLPEVTAHFALLWDTGNLFDLDSGELDLATSLQYVAFEAVSLDLGKFLGDTIGPVVEKIQEVTDPFQPIIDIVTAAIPVLSDLAGEPVTLVDIAAAFGEFNPDLIYAVADLISLVNSIPASPGQLILPYGDFVLIDNRSANPADHFMFGGINSIDDFTDPNFSFSGADASDFGSFIGDMEAAIGGDFPNLLDGVGDFLSGTSGDAGTASTVTSLFGGDFNRQGENGEEYGFAFPIFENPAEVFGLLVGRQATIVTYDLPPFLMDFSWKQSFPIYGPLWGVVTASVGMKIDLAFGYDTQGVADFFDSGFTNPLTLLGGLFIADTDIPEGGGVDVPELVLTGSIGVGAELNAGVASAGATVNIIVSVNFDLYDPNQDDKIRIDELISTFLYEINNGDPALAPISIFDINGEVSLQLKAFLEILLAKFTFDITPPITLFEFSIPFEREPFLATERSDGSLLLNIGTNAAARMNGDLRDLSEEICVEYIGDNRAKVWSPSLGIDEGGAQIYEVDPKKGIFAYGGEGNDVIVVKGDIRAYAEGGSGDDIILLDDSSKPAEFHGGIGNDTLIGSNGADRIWGDQGDDTIHGRAGNDWLFGDGARISDGDTGSLRVLMSDEDGNDIIWGGGGDDIAFGGGGNDILAGDSDAIPDLMFAPFTVCGVMIDLDGPIADSGMPGEDFLFGDGGRIAGTGDPLVLNLGEFVDADDQNRTKFPGITRTDSMGGGSDNIFGQAEDDVIFAGSGDDQADGGTEDDTIYGESGLDTLSGGANDDEIQGGLHKDTIFGFGPVTPGPSDPFNDGGNSDASDGDDLIFGDQGNDLIRGNLSADDADLTDNNLVGDVILGGRGADVIFGDGGTDHIFGENEGDLIFGGAGNDYIEGGTGNDTVFGDDGLVLYFAGTVDDLSDDRVIGDAVAFGAPASLWNYYDTDNDDPRTDDNGGTSFLTLDLMITYVRSATDGDDTVIGGEGDDIAFGGAGDDTMFGDLDPVQWLANYAAVDPPPVPAGADTLIGDGGLIEWFGRRIDFIESFKGVDSTEAGDDTISGNGGPDHLLGGGGSDFMYGRMPASFADGPNNQKLDEDVGIEPGKEISDNDIMIGDDGVIDIARNDTRVDHITTTSYSPLLGETYDDMMFGNWGWDVMLGGLGEDTMEGDTGLTNSDPRGTDDVMLGDNGELDFTFDTDTDLDTLDLIRSDLDGEGGVDTMGGNQGSDVMFGGTAGDFMYGDNPLASSGAEDGEDIMLGDNGDIFLIGTVGRLIVTVAHMTEGTAVDLITTTDTAPNEDTGGPDTMSGSAKSDIMLGGVNNDDAIGPPEVDTMYGDLVAPTPTTIEDDEDDILLGDNGLLDFTYLQADYTLVPDFNFADDGDRNTLDLIRSFEDALGGTDLISGNKGLDVGIGGTSDDTIFGDDDAANAADADLADILLGDNADIFLVDDEDLSGGDIKLVLDTAVMTIRTTDEDYPAPDTGGVDTIAGNAGGDIIAGGVEGDTLYGDQTNPNFTTSGDDGDDIILGDNGLLEWLSTGRLGDITGIDIQANNVHLFDWFNAGGEGNPNDTDLTTLDLITTEQPENGGRDNIWGDEADDLVFGGTDLDVIHGDDGDEVEAVVDSPNRDVLIGDHGRLYPQFPRFQLPNSTDIVPADFPSRNFFAIDIGDGATNDPAGGEGDIIRGEEGADILIGQQGDDRMWGGSGDDDMIGGHNVAGGYDELDVTGAVSATLNPPVNDLMDGGSGDDAMAGDNAIIWRRGDDITPRFRALADGETAIYTTSVDGVDPAITANVDSDYQSNPKDVVGRDIQLVDHSDAVEADPLGRFGADVMAGGANDDVMYGQLANDLMQGDGSIDAMDDGLNQFVTRTLTITDTGVSPPEHVSPLYFNVPESPKDAPADASDGDDNMEGNGGSDLMFGGLGQDDMIGGSSELFGLDDANAAILGFVGEQLRPDGSDIIFGGSGAIDRLMRNDFVGSTDTDAGIDENTGAMATDDDPSIAIEDRHSRDADFIMGDNANLFRLVKGGADGTIDDVFLEFNYDQSDLEFEDRGNERIVVRGMQQLDYTLGGADFTEGDYDLTTGAADPDAAGPLPFDNGTGDLIHGESGDDYVFGMTGNDVMFGESDDDDIVGGYGNDWASGGTGQDGILGDDGLLLTSRNRGESDDQGGEPLYGIAALFDSDPRPKYSDGTVLNEVVKTPGNIQYAVINVEGDLKKSVDIVPFSFDSSESTRLAMDDEFPDNADNTPFADDIIFGGLDDDFLHGASGDDAISGAEALENAFVPVFDDVNTPSDDGIPDGTLDLGYSAFYVDPEVVLPGAMVANPNPGDVLAFNPVDLDGQHLNNRFRAGEFFLYDEYDPLRKIQLNADGTLWKPGDPLPAKEFLLNFDKQEGLWRPGGQTPGNKNQSVEYGPVNDDGRDAIFGDLGNDWIVGGTGRDNTYGGWGNDLLNADDDHETNSNQNDVPDTHPDYEDRAYDGAGRDVLIANTGGDRLIGWVGEYNSYLVPFAPFGMATVSRTVQPFLPEFLYAISAGDGADPTRYGDAIGGTPPPPTQNDPNPGRNGEPHGELGLILQKDFAWQDQTGAPADPQAGNIPGGQRDVLRSASFNGLQGNQSAQGFFVDNGNWTVADGKYQVQPTSLGQDALSVFNVNKYIPKYFEVLATLNPVKPTGGYKANAYVVFDYHSATDFKFAGINVSTNKLVIGHREATSWAVDVQGSVQGSLKAGRDYNVFLSVNGSTVTLIVDNNQSLSYAFDPRVDEDGFMHFANEGMVGLGSENAKAKIDNMVVQRLAPVITYTETVDFNNGSTTDLFGPPTSGTWNVAGGRYNGTIDASGSATSLTSLVVSPASLIQLSATLNTEDEGGFTFDQYDAENFKFVTISSGTITIGHRTRKGWFIDATYSTNIVVGSDYKLGLTIAGTTVSVTLDDQPQFGHTFNALVTDGGFGLLSRAGTSSFDTFTVQSDDGDLGS